MILSALVKQKFFRVAEVLHLRIFGHEMEEEMRKFLGNLSWSFFGGVIAAGIMFAVNIFAGRWLGPEEYGKYNAVIAALYFLIIPMGLGLDTAISYYISKNVDKSIRNDVLSSAIMVTIALLVVTGVSLLAYLTFFSYTVSQHEKEILLAAFVLASFFVVRNLADAVLRGLHRFKDQSTLKIIESLMAVALLSTLLVFLHESADYRVPILSLIFGYAIFVFVAGFFLRKEFRLSPVNERRLSLIRYGSVAVLGSVSGFLFFGMDKFFVQSRLGFSELGLYSAYFFISIGIAGQLGVLIANVLFPVMAKISEGRRSLLGKINKTFVILLLPSFLFFNLLSFVAFLFLGSLYQYSFFFSSAFSFAATIFLYFTILWWFIASEGRDGIFFTSTRGIIAGIFFLITLFLLRRSISIELVPIALSASLLYAIIVGNLRVYNKK